MPQIKNNQYRSTRVVFLLWIIILFDVIIIFFDFKEFLLFQNLENHTRIPACEATANDLRQAIIGILYFIVTGCSGIAFLSWFHRAYTNLVRMNLSTNYRTRLAIWSFFIPVINLYMPYKIMCEIWVKTNALVLEGDVNRQKECMKHFIWWWILWLASIFAAGLYFYSVLTAIGIADLKEASLINIISSLVDIPAALVTITVIKKVSKVESQLYAM